jgi:hypothetical protein
MSTELYVLNPKSQRYISRTSRLYEKLVKQGVIVEPVIKPTPPPEPVAPLVKPPSPLLLKRSLAKVAVNVIAENRSQLAGTKDLDDDQVDQLLKRLLYEKLCIKKPKRAKSKAKAKKKKKVIVPSSSEEESSESESESD